MIPRACDEHVPERFEETSAARRPGGGAVASGVRRRSRCGPVLGLLAALAVTPGGGCVIPPPFDSDATREESSERYRRRVGEIDRLADLGKIREAIKLTELALIDYYHSEELRDRLARLRSIRQVLYTQAMEEARLREGEGAPRTALAILRDVDTYGDETMIQAAHRERDRILAAHPAILSERREAPAGRPASPE